MGTELQIIAHIESGFTQKFGIPRQSGLVADTTARIVFEPPFRNPAALRGIEGFDYLWLLWGFSENGVHGFSATVKPPRLGGRTRMGVFATRSPYRPNDIGLSSVRLERVEWETQSGPVLWVKGADLLDGTPIYDIKPYLPTSDAHPDARAGFAEDTEKTGGAELIFPKELLEIIPEPLRGVIKDLLRQDPRPGYDADKKREYRMSYGGYDVTFLAEGACLTVTDVRRMV